MDLMEVPPRAISLHSMLLFLFAIAAATPRVVAAADTAAAVAPSPSSPTSFLRTRCATTLYPAVCYDSLLPYAATFQTSHARLARVAADVAAAHLRAFAARIRDLLQHGSGEAGGPRGTSALQDCASTISAAADLAGQSYNQLARLDAAGPSKTRWAVSNAQTWLSAAMSDEGTCTDGFADAGGAAMASPAGKEVDGGVTSVKQYTSNALALVNGIPL